MNPETASLRAQFARLFAGLDCRAAYEASPIKLTWEEAMQMRDLCFRMFDLQERILDEAMAKADTVLVAAQRNEARLRGIEARLRDAEQGAR